MSCTYMRVHCYYPVWICQKSCKGVVDKYIEFDNVIVLIDAVLISKEAQRHVIYNTEFQSYWKLFIILTLLETYGLWHNDSLLNIVINSVCNIKTNATVNTTYIHIPMNKTLPDWWQHQCSGWVHLEQTDSSDLFIWEKDFYIQFISTFAGILAFIFTVHLTMKLVKLMAVSKSDVTIKRMLKAFSMANVSILFTLPMLVWGNADTTAETRTVHYSLVFGYNFFVFFNTLSIVYEAPAMATLLTLVFGNIVKYSTTFHITPFLRGLKI